MLNQGAKTIISVDVGAEDNNDLTNYGDSVSGWSLLLNRWNPFAKKMRVSHAYLYILSVPSFFTALFVYIYTTTPVYVRTYVYISIL